MLHPSVGILVDALDELLLDGLRVLMKHLIVGQQVVLSVLFIDRGLSDNLTGLEVDRVVLGGVHKIRVVNRMVECVSSSPVLLAVQSLDRVAAGKVRAALPSSASRVRILFR